MAKSSGTDVCRVSELLFWHGTDPGLFKCILQKLCKERHLHPYHLQLFSSTQVFAQSRSSPASRMGRAKLELTLTLFVQQTEYDFSLLSLSVSFKSLPKMKIKIIFCFLSCIRETSSWKCHENWCAPMKNVDFDDSAFSQGRKSSFVPLTSSQQMAQRHVFHVSSQEPVPKAAEKAS